jgi:hypothetical protein
MTMIRHTPTSVRITGRVDFGALTTYVKDRIAVRHAEMLDGELLFPDARIRGNQKEIFRLTLREDPSGCVLVIRNETRPPATHGLTEKQRWERVGLRPGGGLLNPNQME